MPATRVRLPASITPIVSMKARRVRSIASRGPPLPPLRCRLRQPLLALLGAALDRGGEVARVLRARDREHATEDEERHAIDAGILRGVGGLLDARRVGVGGEIAPHAVGVEPA